MDVVFLGDSWGDDVWNGHKTWPTLVSERNGWRHVNLCKAGHCVDDCLRSVDVDASRDTLWVIHVGGNDLLYWVLKNPLSVLLDLFSTNKPRFRSQGRIIASRVSKVIERLKKEYDNVIVCSNTACYHLPLCRLLGLVYAPFSTKKHMEEITTAVNGELMRALSSYSGVTFYDQSKVLSELSWKWDLYHPSERSHSVLAERFCENCANVKPLTPSRTPRVDLRETNKKTNRTNLSGVNHSHEFCANVKRN
jgi:hypothetical protein